MKALTVRQPWASLIVGGFKRIETRTRDTKHRGPLAIHAGLAMPCRLGEIRHYGPDWWVECDEAGLLLRSTVAGWHPYRLPLGAIVGTVDLFQTRSTNSPEHRPGDEELPLGDHSADRFGWYLNSATRCRPVSCKGKLSLWTVPDDIAARLA